MNQKQISLFLIIYQSFGIRLFDGQGLFLSLLLFFLNIKAIRYIHKKDAFVFLGGIFFFLFYYFINTSYGIKNVIFLMSQFIVAGMLLIRYSNSDKEDFSIDLIKISKIYVVHAGLSYLLCLIVPFLFFDIVFNGYKYRTLLGLFYVADGYGFLGLNIRSSGLVWEPGIIQLLANLYGILLVIKKKINIPILVLLGLFILSTNSTTGFLGYAIVLSAYIFAEGKATVTHWLILALVAILFPIASQNIENKLTGRNQTSGQARMRDAAVGALLISEKPLLGHGFIDRKYLLSNNKVVLIDMFFMNETFVKWNGEFAGGYTNGFLTIFIQFGLPLGILLLLIFYYNNLAFAKVQRLHLFALFVMSFFSEPITNTSFFYLITISAFYRPVINDELICVNKDNENNINYYSNI